MILSEYKKHKNSKLNAHLLWDMDLKNFDYINGKKIVVERTVERGDLNDWWAILNMYGVETVKDEIKNIPMMKKRDMNFVHKFFSIPLEELKSYRNFLIGKKHWTEE